MKRVGLIDGLRDIFLVFMFITHLNAVLTGGVVLRWFSHAQLGFVQDAQGFIFVSGLMVGMVYGPRMLKLGFAAVASALWRRALQLYAYMVCCLAIILGLREFSQSAGGLELLARPARRWQRHLRNGGSAPPLSAVLDRHLATIRRLPHGGATPALALPDRALALGGALLCDVVARRPGGITSAAGAGD